MRKPVFLILAITVFYLGYAFVLQIPAGGNSAELTILYTGNTFGELKPCGCAKEVDLGGIERRETYFKEMRRAGKNILLLDTGDDFKEPTQQGKIKARFLMKSMALMGYDAVMPGDRDLVYGNRFIGELKEIPWVATNMRLTQAEFIPKYRIKRFANGLKAAVVAAVDPGLYYAGENAGILIAPPREAIETTLRLLHQRESPDLVVLLTHMAREKALLTFMDIEGVDVIVNGHIEKITDKIDMTPVQRDGKIFVQPGPRGQHVGELTVFIDPQGRKTFQQRMVKLDSRVKSDPEMVKLYSEYNKKIEDIFFASLAAKRERPRKQVYAAETVCKQCHADAHDTWSRSRHGRAYGTLTRVHKAFDPECLVCHTTGFNQPGGFISENDTPELKHVQCEACHGPGLEHSQAPQPGWSQQAGQACKRCHVKDHSPRFNYADYWPRITH